MGSAISAIRNALGDDEDVKKAVDDALTGMKANADKSMDLFYQKIEAAEDSKLIPIDKVVGKFNFFQCKVSTDSQQLQSQIKGLISDLAGGNWSSAIADSASAIIGDMLGSSSGGIQEQSSYCISMDPLGGLYRLDQYYLSYNYTSSAFVTHIQNSVACCVVKSSIDLKALDDNILRLIVNDSFPGLPNAQRAQLYEAVAVALLPIPPTKAAMDATATLAKFWDDNMKPVVSLNALPLHAVAMVVIYLAPALTAAAVGLFTDRIVGKITTSGYSAKGSYDADKKIVTFEVRPAQAKGGGVLRTGQFSCAYAETLIKNTVIADEEHGDFTYQSSACQMDNKVVSSAEPEFHMKF